jgi:hypothetical protein
MFTKKDYTQTTVIPVNSKRIKIVTTHPTGSFSLDKTLYFWKLISVITLGQ